MSSRWTQNLNLQIGPRNPELDLPLIATCEMRTRGAPFKPSSGLSGNPLSATYPHAQRTETSLPHSSQHKD